MANVTIVATHTVKPTGGAPQEGGFYLSAWDRVVYGSYNKTVHFYKAPAAAMAQAMRESLGQALAHFGPLSGRLRWAGGRLEVDCNAKGVVLAEAECDEDLGYFEADLAPEKMKLLVPAIEFDSERLEELPLMLVQLTRLRCGGASVGIAMCHVLVDGSSAFPFFAEWARLARGEQLKEAPHLDRRVLMLSAREGKRRQLSFSDHVEFSPPPLLLGKQDSSEERSKEIVKVKLPLTEAQLHALKATANSPASHDGVSRPYTRYEVVTAHMWRSACKARGHKEEQPTTVYIVFNIRNRVRNVAIPPSYFGNAAFKVNVVSKAGELMSNPLGFVCSKIRETIDKVDEDYIWSNIELLEEKEDLSFYGLDKRVKNAASKGAPYYGNPNLRVTSWLTLPLFDMDFGWGKPVNMSPIVRDLDGSSYLVPSPNDDGSIEVALCLQVDHADKFKKYFYEDIPVAGLGLFKKCLSCLSPNNGLVV